MFSAIWDPLRSSCLAESKCAIMDIVETLAGKEAHRILARSPRRILLSDYTQSIAMAMMLACPLPQQLADRNRDGAPTKVTRR